MQVSTQREKISQSPGKSQRKLFCSKGLVYLDRRTRLWAHAYVLIFILNIRLIMMGRWTLYQTEMLKWLTMTIALSCFGICYGSDTTKSNPPSYSRSQHRFLTTSFSLLPRKNILVYLKLYIIPL